MKFKEKLMVTCQYFGMWSKGFVDLQIQWIFISIKEMDCFGQCIYMTGTGSISVHVTQTPPLWGTKPIRCRAWRIVKKPLSADGIVSTELD